MAGPAPWRDWSSVRDSMQTGRQRTNAFRKGEAALSIIIIGAMGNIGRRLMAAFPGAIGIDRVPGADIVAELSSLDYNDPAVKAAFESADGVIHVATSPNVQAVDAVHWRAVVDTARLVEAAARYAAPDTATRLFALRQKQDEMLGPVEAR